MHAAIDTARSNRSACSASASFRARRAAARRTDRAPASRAAHPRAQIPEPSNAPTARVTFQSTKRALSVGHIFAQRMQLVATSAKIAGHFAAQQRQHFVKLLGRLHSRIDHNFDLRIPPSASSRKIRTETACECRRYPAGRRRASETSAPLSAAPNSVAGCTERKPAASESAPSAFFASPTTRNENEGHSLLLVRQFHLCQHRLLGETRAPAVSNFSSMPVSTARESTPEIKIPASKHARIMNSRLFPVFTAAKNQNENRAEVNHSFARQLVIHLIDDPAKARALRQRRHNRDGDPAREP